MQCVHETPRHALVLRGASRQTARVREAASRAGGAGGDVSNRCDCGYEMVRERKGSRCLVCRSCEAYNAAVAAQQSAATAFAKARRPEAEGAWLNEYGIGAFVDGVAMFLGTAEEAAPFVALTSAARDVARHWDEGDLPEKDRR